MKITVGSPPLSFYAVQGAVVSAILRRARHDVAHVMGFHDKIYPQLASADVDVFCATWLPSAHAEYWDTTAESAVQITPLFENGGFFLAVPDYVADGGVRKISDLVDSTLICRIVSVGPGGATLTARAENAVQHYRLAQHGFAIEAVPEADWVAHALKSIQDQTEFAIALWRPCFFERSCPVSPA